MPQNGTPTGVLVITAWLEPGAAQPLRVRLVARFDVLSGEKVEVHVTTSEDEAAAVVCRWLQRVRACEGA
jgi:hypothetical protein